ncbi:YceD family protein [Noviherbaspirillum sedimenti]|uniref:Large ribosomal RNA subunit accumulation protein YceD n=1 Tax=Noviherbaspirillum sedimenti TaxID=2320865 RepID=A0A3A3G4H4_9BURK|nr:YceD family protein [Noviherbaspirillum sedimenti]RJG01402.1 DUF177 domain-containing protein [Noviherbaspirillum sedimenti]
MEAILIDAFEFCRLGESRTGEFAVADFPRLVAELAVPSGVIRWTLTGGKHTLGYPQLTVTVTGAVQLMCQRCLTPYEFAIDVESVLVLAQDEVAADELEASLDDESLEVIAGSRQFGVTDLVEDEALLALPVSPRHDVCPEPSQQASPVGGSKAPSPFGALKDWKR